MGDPIYDAKEVEKVGHMNSMVPIFLEPGQARLTTEQFAKLDQLHDIAREFDPGDPVGWMQDFEKSHLLDLEVAGENTRIGKILIMAEIFKKNQMTKEKIKGRRRDFSA